MLARARITLILVYLVSAPALAQTFADADQDGVADALDNCWQHANADQTDVDRDGLGNRCDPDYDGTGLVNLLDLARFKQSFFTNDPTVDLTGDGFVNLLDLAIVKAFFLKPPGPGQWQPAPTRTCGTAIAAARQECCPGYETDPPPTGSVLIPTDCDCTQDPCVPAGYVSQECLPGAVLVPSAEEQCPAPGMVADSNGVGGDPDCMDAIETAKDACGLSVDQHLDLQGDTDGEYATTLPVCEALEDWKLSFTCDPFSKLRLRLTPAEQAEIDASFDLAPEDATWLPGPAKPPVADPPAPIAFPFPTPDDANEPVELIRAEIPGNLVRFHLARAALAPVLVQMENDLEGVVCQPDDLTCDLDLLDMQDFSDDIEASSVGSPLDDGLHFRVDKTADGYRVFDISFKAEDSQSLQVVAEFTGEVLIYSEGRMHLDFEDDAYFGFLPLHDPRGANGYATTLPHPEHNANYLDRAMVILDLSDPACQAAAAIEIETPSEATVVPNGKYFTFSGPFKCHCNPADPEQAYCVAETFPRPWVPLSDLPVDFGFDPSTFPDAKFHNVYCSAKDPLGLESDTIGPERLMADATPLPAGPPTALETLEVRLDTLAAARGLDAATRALLLQDVHEFACSKQYANRLAVGPITPIDLGAIKVELGRKVASAIGVQGAIQATMPTIKAEVTPGALLIHFDLGSYAERWFEDEWWTFPLGWLTQWFLEIFSAIASILSSVLLNLVSPVSSIEFGDLQLLTHGLISHRSHRTIVPNTPGLTVVTPEISLGVRRVAMNVPEIDVTPLELAPNWQSPSCELQNAEDFVDWALSLFLCPLEVALNLGKFAVAPILVLFKLLANVVIDAVAAPSAAITDSFISNAANLEPGNNLGKLFAQASRTETLLPYYLDASQTPGSAPGELGVDLTGLTPLEAAERLNQELPPPFASLCLGAGTGLDCFLARLFLGSASRLTPQLDVVRMGAKTHYRSFADLTGSTIPISAQDYADLGLDWNYPPVRYCVQGDTPPGAPSYPSDLLDLDSPAAYLDFEEDELLDDNSDFDEIEVSSAADATPTDWRAQCAAFADVKITTLYFLRRSPNLADPFRFADYELRVQATKRTNFLLNEVFFCENDASCDPSMPNAPMRERAGLAMCSLLADMWWRTCNVANCGDNPPHDNVLRAADSAIGLTTLAAVLRRIATEAGQPALSTVIDELGPRLPQCIADLEAAGYVIPEELVLAP
jgi:hypothetical protein